MSETPNKTADTSSVQISFEQIAALVSAEFQVEEALVEHNVPTYYLKQPQETKQAFLRLLKNLKQLNVIPILRREHGRIVLRVIPKPPTKKSNILINWILFFATIGTTFLTGYILSTGVTQLAGPVLDPWLGGLAFTVSIMAVFGLHEMGHKLSATKRGTEATPPYFIPGPPPILGGFGTFGAVIMLKSLPSNRDSLFDQGASGPIISFIIATAVTLIGIPLSIPAPESPNVGELPSIFLFTMIYRFFVNAGLITLPPVGQVLLVHPIAMAGWVGMIVTMLQLLPAAQLDGGHVARSLVSEKLRTVLTFLSILLLIAEGFWPMAFFVVFISMYKHPGPLDDVSGLSMSRKLVTIALLLIFVLCSFVPDWLLQML
jgi:membrane-associated protease RseP (regulator of RpoE activity)